VVLIPPDVDDASVVVTLNNLVVVIGGVVVENPGVVALFLFSWSRSGAANEEERGRRNRASIVIASL